MEIDNPARLAETPRVRVVCPHLGLGDVESKSPEDARQEARTASCGAQDQYQSRDSRRDRPWIARHASTVRGRGRSTVSGGDSAASLSWSQTLRTTRSAAWPSSSAQNRARNAA